MYILQKMQDFMKSVKAMLKNFMGSHVVNDKSGSGRNRWTEHWRNQINDSFSTSNVHNKNKWSREPPGEIDKDWLYLQKYRNIFMIVQWKPNKAKIKHEGEIIHKMNSRSHFVLRLCQ